MKIKNGDKVKILTGKDAGKTGKVMRIFAEKNRIVVEGVHVVKRHVKPGIVSKEGGIISMERPVDLSNVMLVDPKGDKPIKVGYKLIDGKKYRFNKKTGETL